ncbi:glycosyltransferase family 4 protein [Chlorogloea sp. CCALA 695]|uniref:glycosyltransferase family 4 protein n=1 Tax=Chlorogloea sp. CCALA 695 TaxID=2107693 RepID=UPI000D05D76D|nr:glycosyltransferase family 1 protein [Chlorogloea sp. CCALA 695]PSB32747.1 glycosyltransferase family 1 protein [Chlorogloea sp. CCALA 695]
MRIFYDGLVYKVSPNRGVSRYFHNIISKLPENCTPLLTTYDSGVNYPSHPNLQLFKYKKLKLAWISSLLEQYYFNSVSNSNKFDIAHPTYYSLFTRQEISKYNCPVVLTVWDMIHELFSEQIDVSGWQAEKKRKAIYAAQIIICISENTKKDLLERYSLPESQVKVTYLASSINASIAYGTESVPFRPYYLYVGERNSKYKNFNSLLSAFAKAVSVRSDLALCVVGQPINQREKKLIGKFKLANHIEHYSYPNDCHLAKLYRCSIALVYPSLYEGFGIPPLEAMSCGTVAIASDCSSIPEVVGDAGILFNPQATLDLADILLSLIDNSLERERLIAKGYQRANMFSWDKTVAQTFDIYRSVT